MGLSISLNRVEEGQRYGECVPAWDTDKYAGDREFEQYCLRENIECRDDPEYSGWGDVPVVYWRPKDLDAAEAWVRANIVAEGNQQRMLDAFTLMKDDASVYFYSSW